MDRPTPVIILVAGGILAAIVGALALVGRLGSHSALPQAVLSEEQRAYFQKIVVTDARMSAAQNFLGGTVAHLDARVTNRGAKVIRRLELELKFVDTLGQVVLMETARPITARTPPLKPGETRPFTVSFEHMPADWNQAPPALLPAYVEW